MEPYYISALSASARILRVSLPMAHFIRRGCRFPTDMDNSFDNAQATTHLHRQDDVSLANADQYGQF